MSGTRSKTGCYTCRLRKKKCDEQKPFCLTCRSREILCYGYGEKPGWMYGKGSWKEIMESKEAKDIRESAETTYKLRRRNQTTREKHAATLPHGIIPREKRPMTMHHFGLNACLPATHSNLRHDMKLLMTFLDIIFPLQYGFYGLSSSGGRGWLLHTLLNTEPFRQASLSVTVSFETGMRNGNLYTRSELDPVVRRLQTGALRGLQRRVNELGTEKYYGKELLARGMEALAIMTQLVSLEVFSFVEGQWEMHLQAARMILGMFQKKWAPELFTDKSTTTELWTLADANTSYDVKALKFFISSFVWIDIIANATFGAPPHNPRHFDYLPLLRNGSLQPQKQMGCQSCVLVLITEITALEAWKKDQMDRGCLSVIELATRASSLNDILVGGIEAKACAPPINSINLEADSHAVNFIFAFAALIFLHTVVSGPSPHTPEIKDNVTKCLERFEALPGHVLLRNCWPFTIAGCMATEDQYDRFRDVVARATTAKHPLGTTWKGLRVMEECWRLRKDEPGVWCWRSTMKKMGVKILLI
ncbi:fungal-specific transcription factor domain-containing protein [Halenospora varia]|nr:fungal-specific transcription factor domain-containing protein [Halenospora varia]